MTAKKEAPEIVLAPDSAARFAYAFYATNDNYALAAAVAVRALRHLGTHPQADFFVLHHGVADVVFAFRKIAIGLVKRKGTLTMYQDLKTALLMAAMCEQPEGFSLEGNGNLFFEGNCIPQGELDELPEEYLIGTFDFLQRVAAGKLQTLHEEEPPATNVHFVELKSPCPPPRH